MPLQSGHVFASHIGHTGKTTLCFQMSCCYAKRHADVNVLVMDLAEEGDLTKRLLGGVDASKKVDDLFGSVFRLLGDADRKTSGLTRWLWSQDMDMTKHAVKVMEHNPKAPANLYLVSSGAWTRTEEPFTEDKRKKICAKVLESMEKSTQTWKLFCDTDGDRRPSPFTMLGYGLCAEAIVPMHLNKADLDRTETMLGVLADLRGRGEISTQVLFLVWNMVKSLNNEPLVHGSTTLPFTPSKISLDILDACNTRLAQLAMDKELQGVFVHAGDEEVDATTFIKSSTFLLRQLADNVLKPSEELGMPFVQMVAELQESGKKQMKFKSGPEGVEYQAKQDVIHGADEAVQYLSDRLEAVLHLGDDEQREAVELLAGAAPKEEEAETEEEDGDL